MIAGLPGTGLGGVFYLLSALLMPCRELAHNLKLNKKRGRQKNQWGLVSRQLILALAILGGFRLTELLLTFIITHISPNTQEAKTLAHGFSVFQTKPVVFSLSILLTVLLSVCLLRIFVPQKTKVKRRLSH